jgi:hypothetical protein
MRRVWQKIGGHRPPLQRRRSKRGPIHDFAKRTHFEFDDFFMYFRYSQVLRTFAEAFANGFVLEKRTHFKSPMGRFRSAIPKLTPMHLAINVTRHAQC